MNTCCNLHIFESDEIVDSVSDVIKTGKIDDIHKLANERFDGVSKASRTTSLLRLTVASGDFSAG